MARRAVLGAACWAGLLFAWAAPASATSLGTNLVGVTDFSGNLPFSDLMRQARPFCSQHPVGPYCEGEPLELDAAGYPTSLPAGHYARTFLVADSSMMPAGRYRASWSGSGRFTIPYGVARRISTGPNSAVFRITPKPEIPIELRIIETDPSDHLRGIHILLPDAGNGSRRQMFNPAYLRLLRPYTSLRFMDWGNTNFSPLASFGGRPEVGDFTFAGDAGVPLEIMIDLANTLDADPWFNVPTHAGDGYVRGMARIVRRCLEPGLLPSVEYSNETWNATFDQSAFVQDEGERLGLDDGDRFAGGLRFTAHRSMQVWDIWDAVFGNRRYRRVLASQSANTFTGETMLSYRRNGAGPTAGRRADAYAIAPYFNVPGTDDPARLAELRALSVGQLLDRAAADVAGPVRASIRENLAMARRFGVRLVAYEGGQHLVGAAGNQDDEQLTAKLIAANRHTRIRAIYSRYLNQWLALVGNRGGEFNHFIDVTIPSRSGSWGSVESLLQPRSRAPKYLALRRFADRVNPDPPRQRPIRPCR